MSITVRGGNERRMVIGGCKSKVAHERKHSAARMSDGLLLKLAWRDALRAQQAMKMGGLKAVLNLKPSIWQ